MISYRQGRVFGVRCGRHHACGRSHRGKDPAGARERPVKEKVTCQGTRSHAHPHRSPGNLFFSCSLAFFLHMYVPFEGAKPTGRPNSFLMSWLATREKAVAGRFMTAVSMRMLSKLPLSTRGRRRLSDVTLTCRPFILHIKDLHHYVLDAQFAEFRDLRLRYPHPTG